MAAVVWAVSGHAAVPEGGVSCAAAARNASRLAALPEGLLGAIGRVESGRAGLGGRRVAWPFTVDADGSGHWFDSAADAVAFVRAAVAAGARAVDVGCFQIDLESHPGAFGSLREAFDPAVNAAYAAGFLNRLHERLGSWPGAVAAYHSATPWLGGPYARLVGAAWGRVAEGDAHVIRLGSGRQVGPRIVTP